MYIHKQFKPLDWTYPDYRSPEILRFLEQVRDKYQLDLKTLKDQKGQKDQKAMKIQQEPNTRNQP
jgi:3'-phosphoadenosine 5'-phosphosulfate sulfotransferase (PAPS reductase)/FAD synthetase